MSIFVEIIPLEISPEPIQRIPIFIIVHDRVAVLKKCVESIEKQIATPIEIVFHDVASTFPECIEYLTNMRKDGYRVYRSEKNHHHTVLISVNSYLNEHPKCQYYIITDPDIELDNVNGDILDFYIHLLNKFGKNLVIGPMLRIDDIPNYYPKKKDVIKRHTTQFWHKTPQIEKWKTGTFKIQKACIDTTFQLTHRDNKRTFPRPGIRCYSPYSARHLDWYINPKNMTEDQKYYSKTSLAIAHWGKGI